MTEGFEDKLGYKYIIIHKWGSTNHGLSCELQRSLAMAMSTAFLHVYNIAVDISIFHQSTYICTYVCIL